MGCAVKIISFTVLVEIVSCNIVGLTYMDSLSLVPSKPRGDDPCNPLYWYPRAIPDYCYGPKIVPVPKPPKPMPVPLPPQNPIPIPMPMPCIPMPGPPLVPMPGPMPLQNTMPIPMSMPCLPMPGHPLVPIPGSMPIPMPLPAYAAPGPIGMPGYLPNVLPATAQSYPFPGRLLSPNRAVNILPFSDAYSDMFEKHKQKIIRIRLQNLLDEYEYYPRRGLKSRCHRNHGCRD